ncbi:iron chelate uptake ABC transporter family permease subunit [Phototrophicus methaneseepsis]|uniref:Iron chelate uptake ABC transporter family permease subunit n=1 Tax=Phototrophicus methaneseepsis TaxID=2710758 RepID=A0A7S8EDX6_9CHLR|nr:iron chelate uptake ABC transporter family permease subunit [Phototrophicus methaneseepsis]
MIGVVILFMTLDAKGSWDFVLRFRGTKVIALTLVAYAIAVSTVLFQTISNNRILTPSIMGFDALYILIQTTLIFTVGSQRVVTIDPRIRFGMEIILMVVFAGILYRWLFGGTRRSLHLVMLVGIIFGVLFRSISGFMQRIIDPNEFAILQDMLFASFNSFDRELLAVSVVLIVGVSVMLWRIRHTFDVLALGRDMAINLGVNYYQTVSIILIGVTALVAISTALVGPVTFFGLLVANLAYQIVGSHKHVWILPCAILLAMLSLIGGQIIVERVFSFNTSLSIIVEFLGGIMFIFLLIRESSR